MAISFNISFNIISIRGKNFFLRNDDNKPRLLSELLIRSVENLHTFRKKAPTAKRLKRTPSEIKTADTKSTN